METGLDYRGARFYDADICRFLSLDPLAADFPSWSDYNYVLGNPLIYTDPDGRNPIIRLFKVVNTGRKLRKAGKAVNFRTLGQGMVNGMVRDGAVLFGKGSTIAERGKAVVDLIIGTNLVGKAPEGIAIPKPGEFIMPPLPQPGGAKPLPNLTPTPNVPEIMPPVLTPPLMEKEGEDNSKKKKRKGKEHTKNASKRNRNKHEEANTRRDREQKRADENYSNTKSKKKDKRSNNQKKKDKGGEYYRKGPKNKD